MYFIHYIQTYASVNRKGSELQSHILKFKDCLLKDRNALDDLKEEIHCRIEELDARYPRVVVTLEVLPCVETRRLRLVKRCLHLLRRHTGRNQSKDMEDSQ